MLGMILGMSGLHNYHKGIKYNTKWNEWILRYRRDTKNLICVNQKFIGLSRLGTRGDLGLQTVITTGTRGDTNYIKSIWL